MFPSGEYTQSTNQCSLYDRYKQLINEGQRDIRRASDVPASSWFIDPSIQTMLFGLSQHNPKTKFWFELDKMSFTNQEIERYKEEDLIPNEISDTDFGSGTDNYVIAFKHVTRGFEIFKHLDNKIKDMKNISLIAQEDRNHRIRVFIDPEYPEKLQIVSSKYSWELIRKIIALLNKIFPKINVPPDFEPIIKAFGAGDYTEWSKLFNEWFENSTILQDRLKTELTKMLNNGSENKKIRLRESIKHERGNIDQFLEKLGNTYHRVNSIIEDLTALEFIENTEGDEILEYLQKHPKIKDIQIIDDKLILRIISPACYYDTEALEPYYRNKNNIIGSSEFWSYFFEEVFLKEKYTLFLETIIQINIRQKIARKEDNKYLIGDYPKQPHIMEHNCWGNNSAHITKGLGNGEYFAVIEQIVGATQNINFSDTIVMKTFLSNLENYDWSKKCLIENKTKEKISIQNIFEKCKDKKEEIDNENDLNL